MEERYLCRVVSFCLHGVNLTLIGRSNPENQRAQGETSLLGRQINKLRSVMRQVKKGSEDGHIAFSALCIYGCVLHMGDVIPLSSVHLSPSLLREGMDVVRRLLTRGIDVHNLYVWIWGAVYKPSSSLKRSLTTWLSLPPRNVFQCRGCSSARRSESIARCAPYWSYHLCIVSKEASYRHRLCLSVVLFIDVIRLTPI